MEDRVGGVFRNSHCWYPEFKLKLTITKTSDVSVFKSDFDFVFERSEIV